MPKKIKLAVTALAVVFVFDVATYVVQAAVADVTVLAWTYTVAFLVNIAAFITAYVIFWRWPVANDKQKRLIKTGLWFATVQVFAAIALIMVQWTPSLNLSYDTITLLSLVPMLFLGIEDVAVTVVVILKWNA